MRSFLAALAFLTIIPIRFREALPDQVVARSRFWYPVVGLLLGGMLAGWTALVWHLHAPLLGAFLVLVVWVIITGALHIDGFCDTCDGLFGGQTPEERLQIMKDPHVGTFGVAGCVLLLLGKFAALHQVMLMRLDLAAWTVGMAVLLGRSLVPNVAAGAHYPREEGTGRVMIEATRNWEAAGATTCGLAAVCSLLFMPIEGVLPPEWLRFPIMPRTAVFLFAASLFIAVWVLFLLLRKVCELRLGGITGDCLGAAIEVAELVFLLMASLLRSGPPGA
jgi:adenosylcobinamide-GDP ribazoletransferase